MTRFASLALALVALTACFDTSSSTPPGTEPATPECIQPGDDDVLQYMPIEDCAASLVGCDAGGEYFEDDCGCGCLVDDADTDEGTIEPVDTSDTGGDCIDPDTCQVLQYMPIEQCLAGLVGCDAGGVYFEDDCGCGCLVE